MVLEFSLLSDMVVKYEIMTALLGCFTYCLQKNIALFLAYHTAIEGNISYAKEENKTHFPDGLNF